MLRYSWKLFAKTVFFDTRPGRKRVAETPRKSNALKSLKYWHMLHVWDPLIPSSYHHIPKGSKIGTLSTPVSRWGANCNIGSLFLFWSRSKKGCQMLIIIHHAYFSESLKTKSDLPCLQASLRYCCKRLKAVDIWHPTNSDLHGRKSTGNSQNTASCFWGGLKLFGVDKALILTSNNMLLVPPIWPISNPHLRAMIQARIMEQVMEGMTC